VLLFFHVRDSFCLSVDKQGNVFDCAHDLISFTALTKLSMWFSMGKTIGSF